MGRFEKVKPIIVKAAACLGIVGTAMLIVSPYSSQDAPQAAFESEPTTYNTCGETLLKSENKSHYVCVSETCQTELDYEEYTSDSRYAITEEEREEIERIVASEGGYCDYEFQALVAECILNGCEAEGMRPLELFNRGDFWLTNDVEPTEITKRAVSDVFNKGILPTDEKIRYYYNPSYCQSAVHEEMRYVFTHTGCRFFTDW